MKTKPHQDMRQALALCSLALNPNSPQPTASMVRISDGYMTAFGGLMCISVPMDIEIGACFNPDAISPFFRKERGAIAYTLKNNKLVLTEGKERLTVKCLPAEDMVTLDVLGTPKLCGLDTTYLKTVVDVINPINPRVWAQGVSFRNGVMESTNNSIIVSAISDMSDDLIFNLPVDSCKALLKFKSAVISVVKDQRAVKFLFEDGSSLSSLVLTEQMIDTSCFFEGKWFPLDLTESLDKLECDFVRFQNGNVHYFMADTEGVIEACLSDQVSADSCKKSLDILLTVSRDIRISDNGDRLQAFSESCRCITSTRAKV